MTIEGKVFVVTGGTGAIARPILAAFARAGARVVAVGHEAGRARAVADPLGGIGIGADLTRPEGAEEMVRTVERELGRVDGLIHTVGGFAMVKVQDATPADYDRMFDLNMRSLFYTARAVVPLLTRQRSGFLAGFSSEPAWTGQGPERSLYAAAKAAVATFLRSLDGELAGTGVRVAIVYPMGAVDTPSNRANMPGFDEARYIDPVEIAETLLFAASRGARGRLLELPIFPGA
jgi:NAD(P)-dependent dehydrogenase (short-subunit alcohol dehydrogenase family)